MRARTLFLMLLVLPALLVKSDAVPASLEESRGPFRILFRIATVEERNGERELLAESTVEGPPGTDFNINLQSDRFKMSARFLTELSARDQLRLRAKLNTKRLYGYSERGLPLYEEDSRSERLELGFDEAVVLLPFGRGGGDHRLKIEITPVIIEASSSARATTTAPEIKIVKPGAGGFINIEATTAPHKFAVEAVLLENGREAARGFAPAAFLEEAQEIVLQPVADAAPETAAQPIAVSLSVERFMRSRPVDQVAVSFDVFRISRQDGARSTVARQWAGINSLGSSLTYDLGDNYLKSSGKKYELRFKIELAQEK
jgi:hypothetical protein